MYVVLKGILCTCTNHALDSLESHHLEVIHPSACASHNHSVFATDLIARNGVVLRELLSVLNDIQVWKRGLDHDDVRTLNDVAFLQPLSARIHRMSNYDTHNRATRKPLRSRRQLVALPVPERRRAPRSIPERPVERTRELGRVRHKRALVPVASVDERTLDCLDAAVHHVAGGDAVRARASVRKRDLRNALRGWRLVDGAVLAEEAAVPV